MTSTPIGWLVAVAVIATPLLVLLLRRLRPFAAKSMRGSLATLKMTTLVILAFAAVGAAATSMQTAGALYGDEALEPDDEVARLADYVRSIGAAEPAPKADAKGALPDVETMIERLATRLQAKPEDADGWKMLGWSYFNTERYQQAAAAYARAVELDPSSAELRLAHAQAKAKILGNQSFAMAPSSEPPSAPDIRSMVDGLANRLERAPRDVDGWARLIRSRVVLGETEVAASTARKAMQIFRDDPAASARILAAANELGLKPD